MAEMAVPRHGGSIDGLVALRRTGLGRAHPSKTNCGRFSFGAFGGPVNRLAVRRGGPSNNRLNPPVPARGLALRYRAR